MKDRCECEHLLSWKAKFYFRVVLVVNKFMFSISFISGLVYLFDFLIWCELTGRFRISFAIVPITDSSAECCKRALNLYIFHLLLILAVVLSIFTT